MEQQIENLIIGRNSVREAIKSDRDIDAILVAKGKIDGSLRETIGLAKRKGIPVKEVPVSRLDEMSIPFGYHGKPANHQGIAAQIPSFSYSELEDIFVKAEKRNQPPFMLMLERITDPHNLGAIIRSAEVMGAHGVIIPKRRSAMLTAAAMKAACGAAEYLPVVKVSNLSDTIAKLKERNVWVAAADMDGETADKTNLTGALCLVIGSEGEGVSELVRRNSDFIVSIPILGTINSLNASAAAAVLIYEKQRQERNKQEAK